MKLEFLILGFIMGFLLGINIGKYRCRKRVAEILDEVIKEKK